MQRQINIVRWWLIFLIGLVLSFYSLEAAIPVLAMAGFGKFPGCTCCTSGITCNACPSGTAHNQYQITTTGVANGSCATCVADANGTFVLTWNGTAGACNWTLAVSFCSLGSIDLYVLDAGGGVRQDFFQYSISNLFRDLTDATATSCEFSAKNIPAFSNSECNITLATCTVDAL